MKQSSNTIIVIIGPTASGKSDLGIALAKQYDGEVISADSRQVYRGMDIGTGKVLRDLPENTNLKTQKPNKQRTTDYYSEGIAHHLIDVASPRREYNISHFLRDANRAIADIEARGKVPIICGGTHFWVQALIEGQALPLVKPDKALRARLEKKSAEELFKILAKKDPRRAKAIDAKNKYRLIRALEIIQTLGSVPKTVSSQQLTVNKKKCLIIALDPNKETLRERIKNRLEKRFQEGMVEEVEGLRSSGISWKRLESFGLEYRYIAQFLQGKISEEAMKEKLFFEIWHYAKRQLSWLRRWEKQDTPIRWIEKASEGMVIITQYLSVNPRKKGASPKEKGL